MTEELQSTLPASGIEWPALRNHIRCMAHVIQLGSGAFMSSLGVKGRTKSWEAQECNQQFGVNASTHIGKSQRLRKEGNPRINKVSAMKPGLAKIIVKLRISRYSENSETDHHIAANATCVDYVDIRSSKRVDWLSKCQSTNCSPSYYWCENPVEFDTGVAWARLSIMRIHPRVAEASTIQQLQVTRHNRGWMDNRQVRHGSVNAIPILDSGDVEETYGHTASCYHRL